MLRVLFGGGLGNQMFQYAFVYATIKKYEKGIKNIKAIMYRDKAFEKDRREFALKPFKCSLISEQNIIYTTTYNIKILYAVVRYTEKVLMRIGLRDESITKIFFSFHIIYSMKNVIKYYDFPKIISSNYFIRGGFQSWKYFDEYHDELRDEFSCKLEYAPKVKELIQRFKSEMSVCVHIRRGDYVNEQFSKMLAICDYNYYNQAMDYVDSKIKKPIYYIFSNSHDDHEWIKNNYDFGDRAIVHIDMDNQDYIELALMQSCKHFIISNSTFSWWAQYLGVYNRKIVVAPKRWINVPMDTDDIYIKSWHLI